MKKIMISLFVLVATLGVLGGATRAFFSDTETSVNNQFEAGSIDLLVGDSWNFYSGPGGSTISDWSPTNLTNQVFFNYQDIKPGDYGRDTAQLVVNDNPAYLCANITITRNGENTLVEPEEDAGDSDTLPHNQFQGELAQYMNFAFFEDVDDDGVFTSGIDLPLLQSSAQALIGATVISVDPVFPLPTVTLPLVDSTVSNLAGVSIATGTVPGDIYHIGKFWCFGDISIDGNGNYACSVNPTVNYNDSQTDRLYGNIAFYAVQSRNNDTFNCSSWNPNPTPTPVP